MIAPLLPNKPGVPRVDDRRVLNRASSGCCARVRHGATFPTLWAKDDVLPLRALAKGGRVGRLMDLTEAYDGGIKMIDALLSRRTSERLQKGRSRSFVSVAPGGLTTKIHALVDARPPFGSA